MIQNYFYGGKVNNCANILFLYTMKNYLNLVKSFIFTNCFLYTSEVNFVSK